MVGPAIVNWIDGCRADDRGVSVCGSALSRRCRRPQQQAGVGEQQSVAAAAAAGAGAGGGRTKPGRRVARAEAGARLARPATRALPALLLAWRRRRLLRLLLVVVVVVF